MRTSSVKPDRIAESSHIIHRRSESGLRGRLASAENHGIQKTHAGCQFLRNALSWDAAALKRLEMRVVAIGAPPPAAMAENHVAETSKKNHGAGGNESTDLQHVRVHLSIARAGRASSP